MLKIHICQDEDHPEISSPLDKESCETAIRSLTCALIYAVKSDIMFVLEFYSTCAIFDLYQSTCYIETRNYAKRLAQIDRTIDVNIGAQATPWIITGPEEAKDRKSVV